MCEFLQFPATSKPVAPEDIVTVFEKTQTEIIDTNYLAAKYILLNEKEIMIDAVKDASDFLIAADLNPEDFAIVGFPPFGFSLTEEEDFDPVTLHLSDGVDTHFFIHIRNCGKTDSETGLPLLELTYSLRRCDDAGDMEYDFFRFRWKKAE